MGSAQKLELWFLAMMTSRKVVVMLYGEPGSYIYFQLTMLFGAQ